LSGGLAASIDQSHLGASLDIFSIGVQFVSETIDGDRAEVAYTVDGRVPLRRAALLRTGGAWRYDPGPGYDPALPSAFDRMADGLRMVTEDLRSGRISHDAIVGDPDRLLEEVRVRLLPGVKLLKRPAG